MRDRLQPPTSWLLTGFLLLPLLLAACGTPATPAATLAILAEAPTAIPAPTATPTEAPTAEPTEESAVVPPPTRTPTPTPAISPTPIPRILIVQQGQALFQASGCASCHGENGEGIEGLGPALPGHSPEAVVKQVREPRPAPEGSVQMPAYGTAQISDEELEQIVAWIESLGPPMGAGPFAGSIVEAAHLRLALISLEAGGVDDAAAHLQDLAETG